MQGLQLPGDKLDSIANEIAAVLTVFVVVIDHGYRTSVVTAESSTVPVDISIVNP